LTAGETTRLASAKHYRKFVKPEIYRLSLAFRASGLRRDAGHRNFGPHLTL
jgi:hypothetical protein